MASPQLERIADSALLKLVAPIACTLLFAVGSWGISTIVDRVGRIEAAVSTQQSDLRVLQGDVKTLQGISATRGDVLSAQHDAILQLQFDVRMLEQAKKP